jgi:hypothetical protein
MRIAQCRRLYMVRRVKRSATQVLAAFGIACAMLASAGRAAAFRTGSDLPDLQSQTPVRWRSPLIEFVVGGRLPNAYGLSGINSVVREAFAPWNSVACGRVALREVGVSTTAAVHGDGVNTVSFVYFDWETLALPDAAATTDVIYERDGADWKIVEADIYLNAQSYVWDPGAAGPNAQQLFPVLLHEAGHAVGLLHPCEMGGGPLVLDCNGNPGFRNTVMFPAYDATHRELSADDRAGLCFLYGCSETCQNPQCQGERCAPAACDTDAACFNPLCPPRQDCFGKGRSGDPCKKGATCESGYCAPAGHCAAACVACGEQGCTPDTCIGEKRAPLGAKCVSGADCLGGECLAGVEKANLCTRACSAKNDDCPQGWACETVDARPVCAPPEVALSEGCGCRVSASNERPFGVIAIALGLALLEQRRRHRRTAGNGS